MKRSLLPVCLLLCHIAYGQAYTITPRDDAHKKDLTLYAFVSNLQFTIATKDEKALLAVVDSNILLDFSDDRGIPEFRKMWKLDSRDSRIWSNLDRLIRTGGTVDVQGQSVCFPYTVTASLPDSVDLANIFFVLGKDVSIRSGPDSASAVIGRLSNEIVFNTADTSYIPRCTNKNHAHYGEAGEDYDWRLITTYDHHQKGYVYWDPLWNPFGYRMFVVKKNGNWKITCLMAGD